MRIKLTLSQLKQILKTERLNYPVTFKGADFTDKEFTEFQQLLQSQERG